MSKEKINIYDAVENGEKPKTKKVKKERKLKKWIKKHKVLTSIICILLVIAIIIGCIFIVNKSKSSTANYAFIRTTTLSKGDIENSISATGTVESAETSSVTTSLNYKIKSVNVAVGDSVKEGDIICTLDTTELESQIEREQENLTKTKSSAQSSYNSALSNYNKAIDNLNNYSSELSEAKAEKSSAYTPYSKALNAISSYQSAYDKALNTFNTAGVAYVKALSNYNTAVSNYKSGKITASKLTSAARSYMTAVQNYYGGCSVGSYDISDGSSSSSTNTASPEGNNNSSVSNSGSSSASNSGSSSITVSKTANDICNEVVNTVKSLTNKKLTYSTGTNALLKLSKKATALAAAKEQCNYSNLEAAYQTASNAYDSAEQTYNQYSDAVEEAKTQLTQAKEQLSSASSSDTLDELTSQLDECELKAGQDGTVTALNATVGSTSSDMQAIATLADLNKLKVSITIEEADINNAQIGMSCYITSDASDETLNGTLSQIDPTANENGSFGAEVTVDSTTNELRIGMNASVEILVSSTENVYQVPIDAVGNDDDGKGDYVYRQTGGEGTDMTFEKIYVTTGDKNDYYIEIESTELSEGDVIRSSADLTQGIETGETTESSDNLSSLFGGLFSGMGGKNDRMSSGDMPSNNASQSTGNGDMQFDRDGGNFQPGGMQ